MGTTEAEKSKEYRNVYNHHDINLSERDLFYSLRSPRHI